MATGERGSFGRIIERIKGAGLLDLLEKGIPADKKWRMFSMAVSRDDDGYIVADQFTLSTYDEKNKLEELANLISLNYIIFRSLNKAAIVKTKISKALFELNHVLQEKILKLAEELLCK